MALNGIWEEEDWFPEETTKTVKQTSIILDPKYSVALSRVLSQLDPASFARMARTCKSMYSFCFDSKDIRVYFNNLHVYIENRENGFSTRFENSKGEAMKVFDSAANRIFIREKYPFIFNIDKLTVMKTLDEGLVSSIRLFLEELPVKKISEISTDLPADWVPWNGYLQILQKYQIDSVNIFRFDGGYDTFPDDMARRLLTSNLKKFCCQFSIPDELIFDATVLHWELAATKVSEETFKALVLKCAESNDEIFWNFGRQQFQFHAQKIYKTLPFYYIGPLPNDRPLVVLGEEETRDFWILRRDGKIVRCLYDVEKSDVVFFTSDDPKGRPRCIRSNVIPANNNPNAFVFVPEETEDPAWNAPTRLTFGGGRHVFV